MSARVNFDFTFLFWEFTKQASSFQNSGWDGYMVKNDRGWKEVVIFSLLVFSLYYFLHNASNDDPWRRQDQKDEKGSFNNFSRSPPPLPSSNLFDCLIKYLQNGSQSALFVIREEEETTLMEILLQKTGIKL